MEAGELPLPLSHKSRPAVVVGTQGQWHGSENNTTLLFALSLIRAPPVSLTHRRPYPSHFLYVPSSSPVLSRPNFYLRHVSPPPSSFFRPEGVVSSHEKGRRRRELALIIVIKRERTQNEEPPKV